MQFTAKPNGVLRERLNDFRLRTLSIGDYSQKDETQGDDQLVFWLQRLSQNGRFGIAVTGTDNSLILGGG